MLVLETDYTRSFVFKIVTLLQNAFTLSIEGQSNPSFLIHSKARDSAYQVPAGSASNGLPQFPFCLLHFWLTQQIQTGKGLQSSQSETWNKEVAFNALVILSILLWSRISVSGTRVKKKKKKTRGNQFSKTSGITGHSIISSKSLWRINPA